MVQRNILMSYPPSYQITVTCNKCGFNMSYISKTAYEADKKVIKNWNKYQS